MNLIYAPNYTQIPNVIFDHWMHVLTHTQFKVLLLICRKTFGWHKNHDNISKSQIEKLTSVSKRSVDTAIEFLEENNLIEVVKCKTKFGDSDANGYRINVIEINSGSATIAPPSANGDKNEVQNIFGSATIAPGGSATIAPTKETYTKETNIKEKDKEKDVAYAPAASQLFDFLFEEFRKNDPGKKLPSGKKKNEWLSCLQHIVLDRDVGWVQKVLLHGLTNSFYAARMADPKKLSKDFEGIAQSFSVKKTVSYPEKNISDMEIINKIEKLLPNLINDCIIIGPNYIEFNFGGRDSPHIKVGDNGFKDQVFNNLRKIESYRKIKINWDKFK